MPGEHEERAHAAATPARACVPCRAPVRHDGRRIVAQTSRSRPPPPPGARRRSMRVACRHERARTPIRDEDGAPPRARPRRARGSVGATWSRCSRSPRCRSRRARCPARRDATTARRGSAGSRSTDVAHVGRELSSRRTSLPYSTPMIVAPPALPTAGRRYPRQRPGIGTIRDRQLPRPAAAASPARRRPSPRPS